MSNRLANETSPYLLQHKDNPVDWYPWGKEAFDKAKKEDKPIFLSIGYSACHWCHVIAHESFEDEQIAKLLNDNFVSIKVDKEERPDIDSVYMSVCQAFTGSGGWPTSIFMTADQQPFFAGTYFPKTSRGGMIGLRELLCAIRDSWATDRRSLLESGERIIKGLSSSESLYEAADIGLAHTAVGQYVRLYDRKHGGFGRAPKFPTPHNILFLLSYYERYHDSACLAMAEHTLLQMYKGGLFDHVGFGFCRYSTDKKFLVPHFEKMLYDNALLILSYCKAYAVTKKELYLEVAEKTADYIMREMTSPEGGFYSSQDADSEGEEGKYYLFTPSETAEALGKDAEAFNRRYDITDSGNFEGKSIPNLLKSDPSDKSLDPLLSHLDGYRKRRYPLHRDEKILTFWNALMIAAMCEVYLVGKKSIYLSTARKADAFVEKHLCKKDTLFVSYHLQKQGVQGFLDDYASCIFTKLALYKATLDSEHLSRAMALCDKAVADFGDGDGGFYLYGKHHEQLILRPMETYDGAIPSGNSLMAYNFVRLALITDDEKYSALAKKQLDSLSRDAARYPAGHAMFLVALLEHNAPPMKVKIALSENTDKELLPLSLPTDAAAVVLPPNSESFPQKNGKTTYYICRGSACLPPINDLSELK